jgi:hypothetical protein
MRCGAYCMDLMGSSLGNPKSKYAEDSNENDPALQRTRRVTTVRACCDGQLAIVEHRRAAYCQA